MLSLITIISLTACSQSQPSASPGVTPAAPGATAPASAPDMPAGLPAGDLPGQVGSSPSATAGSAIPQVKISGSGTIDVATYANLYFGSAGQIETITVKEGDLVTSGTVLAKLDTTSLEASVAQAQVSLNTAKLAQIQANSSLTSAEFYLDQVQAVSDIKDEITNDEWTIKVAQVNIKQAQASGDAADARALKEYINDIQADLDKHWADLNDLLSGDAYSGAYALTYDINGQLYDRLTVQDAHIKALAVESAKLSLEQSQDAIDLAQKNLDLVLEELNKATIIAPFDGQVAEVNQHAGDFISVPAALLSPVIYMIDPDSLELVIGVNELDVPQVKVGQKAVVSIDAFPDTELAGEVSEIAPVPTLQGSIVDYDITITFSVPEDLEVRVGMNATAAITAE